MSNRFPRIIRMKDIHEYRQIHRLLLDTPLEPDFVVINLRDKL